MDLACYGVSMRLINCNKGTTLVEGVDKGGDYGGWRNTEYGKSLDLPLNFTVSIKVL